jgi:hypothetical protein
MHVPVFNPLFLRQIFHQSWKEGIVMETVQNHTFQLVIELNKVSRISLDYEVFVFPCVNNEDFLQKWIEHPKSDTAD